MKEHESYFSNEQLKVKRLLLILFVIIVMVIPPALIASKKTYAHDLKKSDKTEKSMIALNEFSN